MLFKGVEQYSEDDHRRTALNIKKIAHKGKGTISRMLKERLQHNNGPSNHSITLHVNRKQTDRTKEAESV
jgi:hypothetical protein